MEFDQVHEANQDGGLMDETTDVLESGALFDTAMDITQYPSPSLNDQAKVDGQALLDQTELKESAILTHAAETQSITQKEAAAPSHYIFNQH